MTNILRRRKRARAHLLGQAKSLISRCEPARLVILDGRHDGPLGAHIRPAQNSLAPPIAWDNAWLSIALGWRSSAPSTASAAAPNAVAKAHALRKRARPAIQQQQNALNVSAGRRSVQRCDP